MFLADQDVPEEVVEVVELGGVERLLLPDLPAPILKRHRVYRHTHHHRHYQLTYMHQQIVRLLLLILLPCITTIVNKLILRASPSIVPEHPTHPMFTVVLTANGLHYAGVDYGVSVAHELSLVAPLEVVHVRALVPEHELEDALERQSQGEEQEHLAQ